MKKFEQEDLGGGFYLYYREVSNGFGGHCKVNMMLYRDNEEFVKEITDKDGYFLDFPGTVPGKWQEALVWPLDLHIRFPAYMTKFENGFSFFSWMVQPDGRYWADEDGFGVEPEDEICLYAAMDQNGDFVTKFSENWPYERHLKAHKEKPHIVVLGGAFNPPTVAHLKLMQAAMDIVEADKGILVPTSFFYTERKLKRAGYKQEALPDTVRLKMLEAMCSEDARLSIFEYELQCTGRGYTFETLQKIRDENPGSQVYFLMGCDKLPMVPRWHRIHEFIQDFKILVAKRGDESPNAIILENPFLREHLDSFIIFQRDEELEHISSSLFREKYRKGDETAKSMVTNKVWELMLKAQKWPEACIDKFRDSYSFLSNFYPAPVAYKGLTYQNAEAAFQAQKCLTDKEKKLFCELPANSAKRMGRQVKLRSDWEIVKLKFMEEIVFEKFNQNPDLKASLLATGNLPMVEGNTWGDKFWGVDIRVNQGENHLGRILMKVREEWRKS